MKLYIHSNTSKRHYKVYSSQMKSTLDEDYESKGQLYLSEFQKVKLTENLRKDLSSEYKMLKHVYSNGEKVKDGIVTSVAWLDDNKLVGYVSTMEKKDATYIEALEITDEYKGYGLGDQLLDYAVDRLGGSILGVAYDNEVAIRMYKNKGFKIDSESKSKVKSGESNNYVMLLEEWGENKHENIRITTRRNLK